MDSGVSPLGWVRKPRILLIDDQVANVRVLERVLQRAGFDDVTSVTDPTLAVASFLGVSPDIVLLDLHMPGLDGFEVLAALGPHVGIDDFLPVLVLTGNTDQEVKKRALSLGAKDFVAKPYDIGEIVQRIRNLLQTRLLHLVLQTQSHALEAMVARRNVELDEARNEILERLGLAAELRDDATGQHTQRVGRLSAALAPALGMSATNVELVRRAAPLHDIGKIGVPDSILLKPGKLTSDEWDTMRSHTTIGARILANGQSAFIRTAEEIAHAHHERWDGAGYPHGLAGEAIPLAARIVAVADTVDALSSDRPYRRALSDADINAEIARVSGSQLDRNVVNALYEMDWRGILRGTSMHA
jgi:putative two-component system response regulator